MTNIDFIIIGTFLSITMLIGCYFVLHSQRANQYMIGDRNFSGWTMGVSMFATYVSNIALIALPATVLVKGFAAFTPFLMLPIATLITNKYFVSVYRKKLYFSIYSYVYERFGRLASVYTSICYILISLTRIAIVIYLLGLSLNILTNIDSKWAVIIVIILVCLYNIMGGIKVVVWTDIFQAFILIGAIIYIGIFTFKLIPLSGPQILDYLTSYSTTSLKDFSLSFSQPSIWVLFIYGLFSNLQGYIGEQSSVQRLLMAKSDAEAQKGLWIGTILILLTIGGLLILGSLFHIFETIHLSESSQAYEGENFWILNFVKQNLPSGLFGLFITAILASSMSTIDSEINAISVIYLENIHKEWFNKKVEDQKALKILKSASMAVGILGVIIANIMNQNSLMLNTWWSIDSLLSGSILGLFILSRIFENSFKNIIKYIIILSILVALWAEFSDVLTIKFTFLKNPFHELMTITLTSSTIIILGFLANKLKSNK